MISKKNEKLRIEKFSRIFFQLGLILALLVTYLLLEIKTQDRSLEDLASIATQEEVEEEIPITQKLEQVKPPPPPPAAPEQLEIVENEIEVEETVLESTETDQNEQIEVTEIDNIAEVAEEEEVVEDVPFAIIEDVPTYPGCSGSNDQRKKCLQEKITELVGKNYDTELTNELGLTQGIQRVFVQFKIDKTGAISDVRVRGPHARLEKEALRVVKMIPKMTPGKQRGRPVSVSYTLPITLKVL